VVQRRELSQLLSEGRDASARIRVENVIATDIAVEVMEMVELYCELLLARAHVLDQLAFGEQGTRARLRAKEQLKKRTQAQTGAANKPAEPTSRFGFGWLGGAAHKKEAERVGASVGDDAIDDDNPYLDTALDEAAVVVFYAWSRFPHEVREFTMLRNMLDERYGKEFRMLATENKVDGVSVPDRLLKSLRVRPPGQELVESYLREIAKAYGVEWHGLETEELGSAPEFVDDVNVDEDGDGDQSELPQTPGKGETSFADARRASETSELNKATPPRGAATGRSPVIVAPPAPRVDNPNPRVKVPGSEGKVDSPKNETVPKKSNNGIPELDELTRRFADLKRKP
jgi:vacuolar protein sorting-associated protein IST1